MADRSTISSRPARLGLGWAVAAMVASAACWGFATVMTKGALGAVPPFALLAIQLAASIGFLWLAVLIRRDGASLRHVSPRLLLSGLLEPGISYGLGVPGIALTSAAAASVIGAIEPALVLVLAFLLLGERLEIGIAALIGLAMAGVVLITASDGGGGEASMIGNLLVLSGTLFAALYVVATRSLVADIAPLPLAALQQSVGFLFALTLFAAAWFLGFERLPEAIPLSLLLLAIASGIVQYALAFWLYLIGLKVLPAGAAAAFLTLIPVFGIAGAVTFLGESLSLTQWLGCGLVVAAMGLLTLSMRSANAH